MASIPDDEVGFTLGDRLQQKGKLIYYWLRPVGIDEHDDIRWSGPSHLPERRLARRPVAAPPLHHDPATVRLRFRNRTVPRSVIRNPYLVNELARDRIERRPDHPLLVEGRHDHANGQTINQP